jgi:signal transduction histidine kinase
LSSEVRHDLFLCCREALNNIVKHANATEVVLRLTYAAPTLIIVISDNGCGFTAVTKPTADDRVSSGHGLGNLQRRMQQLGGSVSFSESSTGGTIVALSLALKESKAPS